MTDTIIHVEHLSKKYVLSHQQESRGRYKTLRDAMTDAAKAIGRRVLKPSSQRTDQATSEEFWALNDLSFEIKQGDRVGIIGRNGAGKSTLLKILSQITEPTSGRIAIRGRVASLLEVGTGFHPELTGRENIFLNGAILGMSKVEIKRKFDEIVAFAEVEKFLDTPVKRYSSGMYVRLAFAVAAHLEPEILIVDEVLAVGDASFQKKCLGKMQEVSKDQGRTVLFVSHNSEAVQRLCSQCLMLERGRLIDQGSAASIVSRYLSGNSYKALPKEWFDLSQANRMGTGSTRFIAVQYSSSNPAVEFNPYLNGPLEFLLDIASDDARSLGSLAVVIYDQTGYKLVNADTMATGQTVALQPGRNVLKLNIKQLHLNPGVYVLGFWLADPLTNTIFDFVESAFEVEVFDSEVERFGVRSSMDGVVTCEFEVVPL